MLGRERPPLISPSENRGLLTRVIPTLGVEIACVEGWLCFWFNSQGFMCIISFTFHKTLRRLCYYYSHLINGDIKAQRRRGYSAELVGFVLIVIDGRGCWPSLCKYL